MPVISAPRLPPVSASASGGPAQAPGAAVRPPRYAPELMERLLESRGIAPTTTERESLSRYLSLPENVTKRQKRAALPEWRELAREMPVGQSTHHVPAFTTTEADAFRVKFATGSFSADRAMALSAKSLHHSLPSPSARSDFLSLLLYCRDPDELRFVMRALEDVRFKTGNFENLIGDLASEYRECLEKGGTNFGHFFELWLAVLVQAKEDGVELVELQSEVPLGNGDFQEVDLTVSARAASGRKIRFRWELYSGTESSPHGKKAQIDRYVQASAAQRDGVALVTLKKSGEDYLTGKNHAVPFFSASAMLMMSGAELAQFLVENYDRFQKQFDSGRTEAPAA